VICSRDEEGVSPQSKFTQKFSLMMMGQYWLGKAKPKRAFIATEF